MSNMSRFCMFGLFVSFLIGVAVAETLPSGIRGFSNLLFPVPQNEVARITSPDNVVDAVMIEIGCGAPCSSTDLVYIVPKGQVPRNEDERSVFSADDFSGEKLSWTGPHLLEIAYTKAFINRFANVSYPFAVFGNEESWRYKVEIRLAPASTGYSYLNEKDIQ
jgi:hypothetical protein